MFGLFQNTIDPTGFNATPVGQDHHVIGQLTDHTQVMTNKKD